MLSNPAQSRAGLVHPEIQRAKEGFVASLDLRVSVCVSVSGNLAPWCVLHFVEMVQAALTLVSPWTSD